MTPNLLGAFPDLDGRAAADLMRSRSSQQGTQCKMSILSVGVSFSRAASTLSHAVMHWRSLQACTRSKRWLLRNSIAQHHSMQPQYKRLPTSEDGWKTLRHLQLYAAQALASATKHLSASRQMIGSAKMAVYIRGRLQDAKALGIDP